MEFWYEYVNIFSRINTYVENIQRTYTDTSITFSDYCSNNQILFYMDGTKIYQAITNIINNACKFAKDMVNINIMWISNTTSRDTINSDDFTKNIKKLIF